MSRAEKILRLRRMEEISVPEAARLLKKHPNYVRANFAVIVHGPKSHHVRIADIEAYQEKRTIFSETAKRRVGETARRAA